MKQATSVKGLCVDVKILVMGPLENNVYIISDGAGTFVVDPTTDADAIIAALDGRPLDAILLTHAHWDHTGAAAELRERTGASPAAEMPPTSSSPILEAPTVWLRRAPWMSAFARGIR